LEDIWESSFASAAKRSKQTDGILLKIELTKRFNSSGDICSSYRTPEKTLK